MLFVKSCNARLFVTGTPTTFPDCVFEGYRFGSFSFPSKDFMQLLPDRVAIRLSLISTAQPGSRASEGTFPQSSTEST